MPSLEQIIRPFVVDPTTPPVPYVTTENEPPPELVRINIGIGRIKLSSRFNPIVPPPLDPVDPLDTNPKISMKMLSSSHSLSIQYYQEEDVREQGRAPQQQG